MSDVTPLGPGPSYLHLPGVREARDGALVPTEWLRAAGWVPAGKDAVAQLTLFREYMDSLPIQAYRIYGDVIGYIIDGHTLEEAMAHFKLFKPFAYQAPHDPTPG